MAEENVPPEQHASSLSYEEKLTKYAQEHSIATQTVQESGQTISVLGSVEGIDISLIASSENILDEEIPSDLRSNYCGPVAHYSYARGLSDGVLSAESGLKKDVVFFQNHSVAYKKLDDSSYISIDWNARYASKNNEASNVLLIHATSLDNLVEQVSSYYGGSWEINDHDLSQAYADAYFGDDKEVKERAVQFIESYDEADAA